MLHFMGRPHHRRPLIGQRIPVTADAHVSVWVGVVHAVGLRVHSVVTMCMWAGVGSD